MTGIFHGRKVGKTVFNVFDRPVCVFFLMLAKVSQELHDEELWPWTVVERRRHSEAAF